MENGTIEFDEELYQKNIRENEYDDSRDEGCGPSPEDLEQLKKDGIINE